MQNNKKNQFFLKNLGYCTVCDSNTSFVSHDPWLRDNYFCSLCRSVPRERAIANIIEKLIPDWREKKFHESSPSPERHIYQKFSSSKNYIASQYFPISKPGETVNGFKNENLEDQTFKSNTFDLVITLDVMEHVYNPNKVFKEIYRTLKLSGFYVFTVPIINMHEKSLVWAKRSRAGKPQFLYKPEYHGNPVDSNGSPVTMHWGYDIINFIEKSSNFKARIISQENATKGIMGKFNEVIVCFDKENKRTESRINQLVERQTLV